MLNSGPTIFLFISYCTIQERAFLILNHLLIGIINKSKICGYKVDTTIVNRTFCPTLEYQLLSKSDENVPDLAL